MQHLGDCEEVSSEADTVWKGTELRRLKDDGECDPMPARAARRFSRGATQTNIDASDGLFHIANCRFVGNHTELVRNRRRWSWRVAADFINPAIDYVAHLWNSVQGRHVLDGSKGGPAEHEIAVRDDAIR